MESFDWASVDWATWGPPLAVLLLGIVGGLVLVARGGARAEGDLRLANLEVRRQVLMNSLRELEADQAKLDPAAYAAQRTALVEEAASGWRGVQAAAAAGWLCPRSAAALVRPQRRAGRTL